MKKIFFFVIALVSLYSCSSDDKKNLDPFVGNWYFFSENGKEVDICNKKSTITVLENGNFSSTNYGNQDNLDKCVIENTSNGKWINKGNNEYEIESNNSKKTYKITFSDNTFISRITIENSIETTTFKRK